MTCLALLIKEVKSLNANLSEDNAIVDRLLVKADDIDESIKARKKYLNELINLQPSLKEGSTMELFSNERNEMNEKEKENFLLSDAMEDNVFVGELIISKYRQKCIKFLNTIRKNPCTAKAKKYHINKVLEQAHEIDNLRRLFNEAVRTDQARCLQEKKLIAQLQFENRNLRQMLIAAIKFGSVKESDVPIKLLKSLKEDKEW